MTERERERGRQSKTERQGRERERNGDKETERQAHIACPRQQDAYPSGSQRAGTVCWTREHLET